MSARRDVALVMAEHRLSERHACRLLELDRSTYRYEARPDANGQLREALVVLARQKPRYGYRRLWAILTRRGWEVNVKRIYRLYRREGLTVRRLKRKRVVRDRSADSLLSRPNQEWALDFVSDALASGRGMRALTIADSYTRESPAIEVGAGISSHQVTRTLERIISERGNLLIHFVDSHPPPYDGANLLLLFAPLLFLLIAFTYGIVRIPSLVSSIFSGSSGESVIPRL